MSQTDLVVSNDSGANVRSDLNAHLQALGSLMAGAAAPGTTYAGMFWLDTTNDLLKRRNEANNAWITVAKFDETNNLGAPYAWNAVLDDALETLASAATTNLATPISRNVSISGTTTITAFGSVKAGSIRHLRFVGALTLTHNATSLILPGGANITTAANDTAAMISLGSGNWLCLGYKRQSGLAVVSSAGTTITAGTPLVKNPYVADTSTTQAHGLGAVPKFVEAVLECLTGEFGYTAGDKLDLSASYYTSTSRGYAVWKDATNLILKTTGQIGAPDFTTPGTIRALTSANWKLTLTPYAWT